MEGLQDVLDEWQKEMRNPEGEHHQACVVALKQIADLWATKGTKYRHQVIQVQKMLMAVRDGLE